uniref:hypothetical protein n=1 Tax=Symbiochloris sp. SG-2018 TaxID=2126034 RepID=UPI002114BFF4|nr:hypothetical protein NRL16_pgp012 [Symbiochloris sp. SG-2018]UTQ75758.1 hypothetical protein [Symbiochloris sp. SG-2018]
MIVFYTWEEVQWHKVERRILRYQQRIYKASLKNNISLVKVLQKIIINSLDAKLLSVRKVTSFNIEKKTSLINGKTYITSEQKIRLVEKLRVDGKTEFHLSKKKSFAKNLLDRPTISDRAKQALVLFALEPEWEARFEANSFGFRPGRSCHDAIEAIYLSLANTNQKPIYYKYVLNTNIKDCFENVDHKFVLSKLNTLPEIKSQVFAWLNAGILGTREIPTFYSNFISAIPRHAHMKAPQEVIMRFFLINVVLHGLETDLKNWVCSKIPIGASKKMSRRDKMKSLACVRYGSDFIIIHKSKTIVHESKVFIKNWLNSTSKFQLNSNKTQIVCSSNGFDFLGFKIISLQRDNKTKIKIYPSKKSVLKITANVGDIARKNRSLSAYDLIKILRPIVIGWANYYKYCECKKVFGKIDSNIWQILQSWVFRRDRLHGRYKIKEKYFPSGRIYKFDNRIYYDNWVFFAKRQGKNGKMEEIWLPRMQWIKKEKFVKVKGNLSIYDRNFDYWILRFFKYGISGSLKKSLFKRQKGRCTWCKNSFYPTDFIEIDHIIPNKEQRNDSFDNLQLLHKHCHLKKTQLEK